MNMDLLTRKMEVKADTAKIKFVCRLGGIYVIFIVMIENTDWLPSGHLPSGKWPQKQWIFP